jgi:hypothetical protein
VLLSVNFAIYGGRPLPMCADPSLLPRRRPFAELKRQAVMALLLCGSVGLVLSAWHDSHT